MTTNSLRLRVDSTVALVYDSPQPHLSMLNISKKLNIHIHKIYQTNHCEINP